MTDALTEAQLARVQLHLSSYWPAAARAQGANHLWMTDVHLAAAIAALTPPPPPPPPLPPPPSPGGLVLTADRYAAPGGSDSTGTGTLANPYATMAKLFRSLQPGQTGMLRGGTYSTVDSAPYHMYLTGTSNGSSAANPVRVYNYPGEVVNIRGPVRVGSTWAGVQLVGNGGPDWFKLNGWPAPGGQTDFTEPAVWAYGPDFLIQGCDITNNDPADPTGNHSLASGLFFGNPGATTAMNPTIRRCRIHDIHWTGSGNQPHGLYCDQSNGALVENTIIHSVKGAAGGQYALQMYPRCTAATIRQIMVYNTDGGIVVGTQSAGQASDVAVSRVVAHSVTGQPLLRTVVAAGSTCTATVVSCHTYLTPHGVTEAGSDTGITDNGSHTTGDPLEANLPSHIFTPFGNPDAAGKGPDWG